MDDLEQQAFTESNWEIKFCNGVSVRLTRYSYYENEDQKVYRVAVRHYVRGYLVLEVSTEVYKKILLALVEIDTKFGWASFDTVVEVIGKCAEERTVSA